MRIHRLLSLLGQESRMPPLQGRLASPFTAFREPCLNIGQTSVCAGLQPRLFEARETSLSPRLLNWSRAGRRPAGCARQQWAGRLRRAVGQKPKRVGLRPMIMAAITLGTYSRVSSGSALIR